jgi:hypothetical protein
MWFFVGKRMPPNSLLNQEGGTAEDIRMSLFIITNMIKYVAGEIRRSSMGKSNPGCVSKHNRQQIRELRELTNNGNQIPRTTKKKRREAFRSSTSRKIGKRW